VVDGDSWHDHAEGLRLSNANAVAPSSGVCRRPLPALTWRQPASPSCDDHLQQSEHHGNANARRSPPRSPPTQLNLNSRRHYAHGGLGDSGRCRGPTTVGATGADLARPERLRHGGVVAGGGPVYSVRTEGNNSWSAAATLRWAIAGNPAIPNLRDDANGNALERLQNGRRVRHGATPPGPAEQRGEQSREPADAQTPFKSGGGRSTTTGARWWPFPWRLGHDL